MVHFLLYCKGLDTVHETIMNNITNELMQKLKINFQRLHGHDKLSIILDCTCVAELYYRRK